VNRMQLQVEEFHRVLGVTVGEGPAVREARLRAELIREEFSEFVDAIGCTHDVPCHEPDLVKAIDALCDLLYVTFGAAVTFGVDLEPFFDEVHRSNMAKAGGPVRFDGKRLKPQGWKAPDIAGILERLPS
jgi:predicted HAD superfamily Cof-like phosphohydrolase